MGIILNNSLIASDVGLTLDYQTEANSLALSSEQGLGRISGEDVRALRENLTALIPDSNLLEVLQVPLVELSVDNEQILTLASNEITDIRVGNRSLWHFSDGGFGHQINGDGDSGYGNRWILNGLMDSHCLMMGHMGQ